jgi:hypothetical protein
MFLMAGLLAVGAIPGWVAAQQLPANATVYGAGLAGPRGLRFGPDDRKSGKWTLIADIGAFLKTHPARFESADDFEPDGTLYSMIALDGKLFTVEPNHGQVFSVTTKGEIKQVIDISASEGHIVPTSIAERNGSLYVGNLNLVPIDP